MVPEAGHLLQQEQPDAVNAALLRLLSSAESPRPGAGLRVSRRVTTDGG